MIKIEKHIHGIELTLGDFPERPAVEAILDRCLISTKIENGRVMGKHDFLYVRQALAAPEFANVFKDASDAALAVLQEWTLPEVYPDHLTSKRIKSKLFPEQVYGAHFILNRRGACLGDEMGVGKTVQLLAAYAELREQEAGLLLVICPNVVKSAWAKEVEKHTTLKVGVVGNGSEDVAVDIQTMTQRPDLDVLVIHYDALVPPKVRGKKKTSEVINKSLTPLLGVPVAAMVLDEAHQVKHLDTNRARAVLTLKELLRTTKKKRPRVWLATGTMISESPVDAWAVLKLTDTQTPSFAKFSNHFVKKVDLQFGPRTIRTEVGYQNLDNLKAHLQSVSIRRLKSDMTGFPDKIERRIELEMTKAQASLYHAVRKNLIKELGSTNEKLTLADAAVKTIRLRQILNHPSLVDEPGESAKHNEVANILEEVLSDPLQKVLIWTEYRRAVEILAERFKHYGVVKLIGGTKEDEIAYLSRSWDTSPDRVAIGIPAFGGTGIDFLSRCRTEIYVDVPFSTVLYRQSIDRVHRRVVIPENPSEVDLIKGSPATVLYVHHSGTVDDLVFDAITRKGSMSDALTTSDEKLIEIGKDYLLSYLRER